MPEIKPPTIKRAGEIKDKKDLGLINLTNKHKREERIKDVFNWLMIAFMVAIFISALIVAFILFYHYYKTENWDKIEKISFALIGGGVGYLIAYLKEHGIKK